MKKIKANITIVQLLEVSSTLRKALKQSISIRMYQRSKVKIVANIQIFKILYDMKAIEIEVSLIDKILSKVLINRRSGLNIMPL